MHLLRIRAKNEQQTTDILTFEIEGVENSGGGNTVFISEPKVNSSQKPSTRRIRRTKWGE